MIKSKQISVITLLIILVVPIAILNQGIDFTDTGWMLTYFQNIFSHPESVTFWFHLYLTNIIGGIWNLFFGNFGLISFKIAGVIIFWLSSYIVYLILKDIMHKNYILVGIALGLSFNFYEKITIIHYNNLSFLFLLITILFIKKALVKDLRLLFIAGFFIGLNTFIRIPNILSVLFIFPILYYLKNQNKETNIVKSFFISFAGVITGILLVFGIMIILGHFNFFIQSVIDLFGVTGSNDSNYDKYKMIKKVFKDNFGASFLGGCAIFTFYLLSLLYSKIHSKIIIYKIVFYILFLILSISSFYILRGIKTYIFIYFMIGIIYISIIVYFFKHIKTSYYNNTIFTLILLGIFTLSNGSDTGMMVGSFGIISGFPVFLWVCSQFKLKKSINIYLINLSIVYFTIISIPTILIGSYRDASNRLLLNTQINHSLLKYVKTTKSRAESISELLSKLDSITIENNTMLCFESIGMVHFITRTQPYLSNPWPLMEMPEDFKKLLEHREKSFLPTVVMAKRQTRSKSWPDSGIVSQKKTDIEMREIMYDFLTRNNYTEIWSNNMFVILQP